MNYLGNSFSLNMLANKSVNIHIRPLEVWPGLWKKAKSMFQICVGHADIARIISGLIGEEIPVCRDTISLKPGDCLWVAQYIGPRLPEGTTTLPEGAKIEWFSVNIEGNLTPYIGDFGERSLYGALEKKAQEIAACVGASCRRMQDIHGNIVWELEGNGFYATLHDN